MSANELRVIFVWTFGDIATPQREAIKQTVAWYRKHLPARKK